MLGAETAKHLDRRRTTTDRVQLGKGCAFSPQGEKGTGRHVSFPTQAIDSQKHSESFPRLSCVEERLAGARLIFGVPNARAFKRRKIRSRAPSSPNGRSRGRVASFHSHMESGEFRFPETTAQARKVGCRPSAPSSALVSAAPSPSDSVPGTRCPLLLPSTPFERFAADSRSPR